MKYMSGWQIISNIIFANGIGKIQEIEYIGFEGGKIMIFLSHNYRDKDVVGPIAVALANKYGKDNVFYDSWSIKPGDGIINEMNNGLEKCKFFFFFISENS